MNEELENNEINENSEQKTYNFGGTFHEETIYLKTISWMKLNLHL